MTLLRIVLLVSFTLAVYSDVNIQDNFVINLLKNMDIEDKCGQMTQIIFDLVKKSSFEANENPIDNEKLKIAIVNYKIGSILGTPDGITSASMLQKSIKTIQEFVLTNSKHKIPVIHGIDSVHGANFIQEGVLFPQQLSLAATFNTELVEKIGQITAAQTRAAGIPWNFSPILDIGRHPLWARLYETFGEDVKLAASMGSAYIKGHQGNDLKNRSQAAVCLKHYIGYSYPFNGRDRTASWIPESLLRETFLPSFAKGVQMGAQTVMINSGDVNGIPGHANYRYLTEILKGELKFEGFTVSDWEDIIRLHTRDKVASTPEEAVRIAVMAGVDMSMVPLDYSFFNHCVSLSLKDEKFSNRVDDAVTRILSVKKKLGLFEDPFPHVEDSDIYNDKNSEKLSLDAAQESIILAKNENNILPLKKTSNILIAGTSCKSLRVLNGGWTYGDNEELYNTYGMKKITILEAIENKAQNQVKFSEGANFTHVINIDETVELAKNSDFIVLCIGEDTYAETGGNLDSLMISESQLALGKALTGINKPLIVVYVAGRPRVITSIVEKAQAVILGFLPGPKGSEAIADILYGDYNPNGKMPITYPRGPNGYMNYDFRPLEDFDYFSRYDAIFSFGHGLSYTTFSYSNLTLSSNEVQADEFIYGSVFVTNTGRLEGKETIIVYLNDEYCSMSRPVKQMKYFEKIFLKPDETKKVNFEITIEDLSFININGERIAEKGLFNVYVSNLIASFKLKNTVSI